MNVLDKSIQDSAHRPEGTPSKPWRRMSETWRRVRGNATLLSWVVACVLPLAAFLLAHWVEPLSGHPSYQVFLGAVALSALYGGIGNGLFSLALSVLLKLHFFLPPRAAGGGEATLGLLLFLALGLMVTWMAGTLRSSQRRLDATLRFIGDAVVLTNPRGQITFMNAVAEVLTGWRRGDAKGKDFHDVISLVEDDRATPSGNPVKRAFQEGTAIDFDGILIPQSADGGGSPVEGSVAPIRDRAGSIVGSVAVLRDISDRRALEAELRTAQKIQALSRLTGPLAHDFNNWLTVIGGHAELIRDRIKGGEWDRVKESADSIALAADEAGRLARQFLILNAAPAAPRGRADINRILDRMESPIQAVLGDFVSVVIARQGNLWEAKITPEQVEQILINLVANARDAMPKGGVLGLRTRNVHLPTGPAGGQAPFVLLEVSDDGCGMDAETKARIFEPFFSTRPRQQGAGLGLSLVYCIVTHSGGRIEVSSEPGKGTKFQVYLPRFDSDGNSARLCAASESKPVLNQSRAILVVESDNEVRRLIASTLQMDNYSTLEAADGREALSLAAHHINHLDLIVTELTTPEVTGPELATRLSLLRPDIKVVYVSSYPKPAGWNKNAPEPNRAFLFKPFSPGELLERVGVLLSAGG